MKIISSAVLFSVVALVGARADLSITQRVEGGGPVSQMTIKVQGNKTRVEATPNIITIMDAKTGDIVTLMTDQKKYMRVPASQAKAAAMAMQGEAKGTPAPKAPLKATGKKETIDGYETEEYVCETPTFKGSFWIATKYPNATAILQELRNTTPPNADALTQGLPDYRDFPGLPLRSRVSFGGHDITTTLSSIKQNPLPAADFSIPADFEEMKMPDMGSLMGGKPAAPTAAPSPKS